MDYIALGKTNLLVSRTALGAMALANVSDEDKATRIINKAYESGINFFDTARESEESERRLGNTLHGAIRKDIFVATKTKAHSSDEIAEDIDKSLTALKTDYIDLYQLDNPSILPELGGDDRIVEKLLTLKRDGIIHHFGIATENYEMAKKVLASSVEWETLQVPFNILCSDYVASLVDECKKKDIGFVAMQPLCGGIIQNIPLAVGFFNQFESTVPLWGAHTEDELQQIIYFSENPPIIDEQFEREVEKLRVFFN